MLRIIRSMYQSVKSCIRHCNTYSDYLNIAVGLRQGEIISPIMFSLFTQLLGLCVKARDHRM